MRFVLGSGLLLSALLATPAVAAVTPAPFGAEALSDGQLAAVYGTGGSGFRMTDDIALASLRQTAIIGSTLRDLWLVDVASPLIAANVRAARD